MNQRRVLIPVRSPLLALGGGLLLLAAGCSNPGTGEMNEDLGTGTVDLAGGSVDSGGTVDSGGQDGGTETRFSFFVTSLKAMRELSHSEAGFGGNLSYGETGAGAGLRGADKICTEIAERSLPGSGKKGWRAFLSAVAGEDGKQVDAIDRIGNGPWYDRLGRLVSANKTDINNTRPKGADTAIINDLPNEDGVPNHRPDANQPQVDNHDILTGTNSMGRLYSRTATCLDWTGDQGNLATEGKPRVGHSWPRNGGGGGGMDNWMSSLDESGCAPGVNLIEQGGPKPNETTVGSGGGYGGIYCFALRP